jgi:hypothetical protein
MEALVTGKTSSALSLDFKDPSEAQLAGAPAGSNTC